MWIERNLTIVLAILAVLVAPIAFADEGCGVLAYYESGQYNSDKYVLSSPQHFDAKTASSYSSNRINPTSATFTLSDFGGSNKNIYHAYYTNIQTGPVWLYGSDFQNGKASIQYSSYENYPKQNPDTVSTQNGGVRAQYYYGKTSVRSEVEKVKVYKRGNSTISITNIADLEKSDYMKKPKMVTKDQYDYYYRPDKYTTLDLPQHYYEVDRLNYKKGIDSNEN